MTAPLVSVIIPTRNRASLLSVAVRSALDQTLRELEVLVVDDASEDRTAEVVAGISDPRLRSLRQPTRSGGAAARNAGIRASRGQYVAFLDDDDEWLPEKLELQLALFADAAPEIGVVYSSYLVVELETGRVIGRKIAEKRGDLARDLLVRNCIGGTPSVVVRRSLLERVGLFDERLPSFQDYDLWIRLSRHCEFDYVSRDLLRCSMHGGRKIWSDLEALDRGIDRMLEKHGSSPSLRRNLAGHSLGVGVRYCSRGEAANGRRAFVRAIRLDPPRARPYLNLVLSLLGSRAFRATHRVKQALEAFGSRRNSAPPSELVTSGGDPAPVTHADKREVGA